jgi:osmotically-inducible protein OsmY
MQTKFSWHGIAAVALAAVVALPLSARAQNNNDAQTQTEVQQLLKGKNYGNVHISVQDGVVTLTGQVDRLQDSMDAEKRVKKDHYVRSVRNELTIAGGGEVNDAELQQKLSKKLIYDRVGYGTTPFNALTLQVHDGVVSVGGVVVEPADKESALSLIKNEKGVRGLEDHIQVAPPSPMDDRIRQAEFRAVYGAAQLNRYAMDPAKPIRIAVVSGHVTLVGVVDSKSDKDIAGIRANGVPGVFSVQNDLQVAGQMER